MEKIISFIIIKRARASGEQSFSTSHTAVFLFTCYVQTLLNLHTTLVQCHHYACKDSTFL